MNTQTRKKPRVFKKRSIDKKKHLRRTMHNKKAIEHIGGSDKCIFVRLVAGLGNQLYIYATGIVAKNKTGKSLCLLYTDNSHSKIDYRKVLFKQGIPVETTDMQKRIDTSTKILNIVHNPHNNWEPTNILSNTSKNNLINGIRAYQNYNSIKSAIPTIRADCKEVFEDRYKGFKDTIASTSAFMHIRRGDYGPASLAVDYYIKGLSIIDAVPEITSIYILSDDIPWCKAQNFISSKIQWFDNEDSKDELKALYLMSLCLGGACISASTFSSWGVILGADQNEKSTIVYPAKWITGGSEKIRFPQRWKSI